MALRFLWALGIRGEMEVALVPATPSQLDAIFAMEVACGYT